MNRVRLTSAIVLLVLISVSGHILGQPDESGDGTPNEETTLISDGSGVGLEEGSGATALEALDGTGEAVRAEAQVVVPRVVEQPVASSIVAPTALSDAQLSRIAWGGSLRGSGGRARALAEGVVRRASRILTDRRPYWSARLQSLDAAHLALTLGVSAPILESLDTIATLVSQLRAEAESLEEGSADVLAGIEATIRARARLAPVADHPLPWIPLESAINQAATAYLDGLRDVLRRDAWEARDRLGFALAAVARLEARAEVVRARTPVTAVQAQQRSELEEQIARDRQRLEQESNVTERVAANAEAAARR
ncbi:MAG: hypothetical protein KC561_13845, partial [Myxococcales bacterium]|nr:hypothetical protein [Myxococcales bacterium]